jgi:hypothetical protein
LEYPKKWFIDEINNPTWLLKQHVEQFTPFLSLVINDSLKDGEIPAQLKEAVITTISHYIKETIR